MLAICRVLLQRRCGRIFPGHSYCVTEESVNLGCTAEQRLAADALQPTLRSGFQARLKAGVDMTSDVKVGSNFFTSAS
jgi:hypothetical protein